MPFIISLKPVGGDQLRHQFPSLVDDLDIANRCFRTFGHDDGMRLQAITTAESARDGFALPLTSPSEGVLIIRNLFTPLKNSNLSKQHRAEGTTHMVSKIPEIEKDESRGAIK